MEGAWRRRRPEALGNLLELGFLLRFRTRCWRAWARVIWSTRWEGRCGHGRQCKQIDPRIELPESPPTDKHLRPALHRTFILQCPYTGVLTRYQPHALQLGQHNLSLEYALSVYIDAPFSLRFPLIRCTLRQVIRYLQRRLRLMEVPVQRRPQHHSHLPRRRARRLELIAARERYGRNVEMVFREGGFLVPVYTSAGALRFFICGLRGIIFLPFDLVF